MPPVRRRVQDVARLDDDAPERRCVASEELRVASALFAPAVGVLVLRGRLEVDTRELGPLGTRIHAPPIVGLDEGEGLRPMHTGEEAMAQVVMERRHILSRPEPDAAALLLELRSSHQRLDHGEVHMLAQAREWRTRVEPVRHVGRSDQQLRNLINRPLGLFAVGAQKAPPAIVRLQACGLSLLRA